MITVTHHAGEYEVRSVALDRLLVDLPSSSFFITDENVDGLLTIPAPKLVLPPGEASKSLEIFGKCLSWLAESGAGRRSTVVAVGGGVIGDLAGFVAAAYMRGVAFLQIPTTLLAQVDSSVGGKVGIDLPEGKNLAGAFLPPTEVRVAVDILASLPARQFTNGMAEVLKYGAILDRNLFDQLRAHPLAPNDPELSTAIFRCIQLKAHVVKADEFETTGLRAILNFGHTIGHAIETLTGYGPVLHGEAIAIGMVLEAQLGEKIGVTEKGTAEILRSTFEEIGLPTSHPETQHVDEMLNAMRRDKKAHSGRLAFALLTQIGECRLVQDVSEFDVRAVLQHS